MKFTLPTLSLNLKPKNKKHHENHKFEFLLRTQSKLDDVWKNYPAPLEQKT